MNHDSYTTSRDTIIAKGKGYVDPQGSAALYYYSTIAKNGKTYNLEVLYDGLSNTIYHFKYAANALGPLPAISK